MFAVWLKWLWWVVRIRTLWFYCCYGERWFTVCNSNCVIVFLCLVVHSPVTYWYLLYLSFSYSYISCTAPMACDCLPSLQIYAGIRIPLLCKETIIFLECSECSQVLNCTENRSLSFWNFYPWTLVLASRIIRFLCLHSEFLNQNLLD